MVVDVHEDVSKFPKCVDPDAPFQTLRISNWQNREDAAAYLEENIEDGTGTYIGRRKLLIDMDAVFALPPPGADKIKPTNRNKLQRDLTRDAVTGDPVDPSKVATPRNLRVE